MITEARNVDPRVEFMDKKTSNKLVDDLYNPAYYWDEDFTPDTSGYPAGDGTFGDYIDHAAKLKLSGVVLPHLIPFERHDFGFAGALLEYSANDKDLSKPQQLHKDMIRDAANAIVLGIDVDLDPRTSEILSNSQRHFLKQNSHSRIREIAQGSQDWWDRTFAYSKILGLDLEFGNRYAKEIEKELNWWQTYKLETFNFEQWQEMGYSEYYSYKNKFAGLAASIAQARVIGLDIPVQTGFGEAIERYVNISKKDSRYYFSHALVDLAILKARKVVAGPTIGIDLYY